MNKTSKNILFMLHLPPPWHGSTVVGKLVKESILLNGMFMSRYINIILSKEVSESGKTNTKKFLRIVIVLYKLLNELIFRRPDLCYFALTTTGPGFKKDTLLIMLLRIFRIRTVYHIHNKGISIYNKNWLNNILYQFIFKKSYVIILSENLYADIEKFVVKEQVFICPNGINDNIDRSSSLSKVSMSKHFKILFLSNIIVDKGVFLLIDACAILYEKGHEIKCDFVGGEGDITRSEFQAYVSDKGLSDHVKYHGKKLGEFKDLMFEQADVFVLPTKNDCFPLTILEAMQHSLPVISTVEGGIPDMIDEGKTGFLIPKNSNAELLSERIEYLILNPSLRMEMGANGRSKYENNFTLSDFEQKLCSILSQIINN